MTSGGGGPGVWAGALLVVLGLGVTACDPAPEGGWGPVAETEALGEGDLARLEVPADGKPLTLALAGGVSVVQPIPDARGQGFDVDGVGAYPGARFEKVLLRLPRLGRRDGARLLVTVDFVSEAAPEAVADWYAAQFERRGRMVARDGLVLNGQMRNGDDWTLVMRPGAGGENGGSMGELRVRRRGFEAEGAAEESGG
ncbi:hypothetical protein [Polymorphobacter sp.]|uniref:hypothetical protein n=1 Tax=Polymorphobacter sp. TaxID=1909290 RepID=UPI003F7210E9